MATRGHLRAITRAQRDTVFLLVLVAWLIGPQVPFLPLWCSGASAALLLWRARLVWRAQALPGHWTMGLLLALAIGATLYGFGTLIGREAGTAFLVLLLALKTLELRTERDAIVVFFLGFFTLLSNFFYSQSLLTAAMMLLGLWGLLTALVNSQRPVDPAPLWQSAAIAGRMALLGTPVMVALFMLFPRIGPLWSLPNDALQARSGLTDQVTPGSMASIARDDSVAFRVDFTGPVPPRDTLYFRGPVLDAFDGHTWRASDQATHPAQAPAVRVQGAGTPYAITLEPTQQPWLLALDASPQPPTLNGYRVQTGAALQWRTDKPVSNLVRYQTTAYTRYSYGALSATPDLRRYLLLPVGFNPRTLELARTLRSDPRAHADGGAASVQAVLAQLRDGGYRYTLNPGVYGLHTADVFWFERKQGYCEHIASAFVILMRAMGIPARLVTGYQGGAANPVDGVWTVRQSDAHAWAEVWLIGTGWQRVDPTSMVAPERSLGAPAQAIPQGALAQALFKVDPVLVTRARAIWEAGNNRWNQWVLNYAQTQQFELLRQLGFRAPSQEDLGYVLAALLLVFSAGSALWGLRWRHEPDPWVQLLHSAQRILHAAGLDTAPHATPRMLAHALDNSDWPDRAEVQNLLLRLEAWRYAAAPGMSERGAASDLAVLRREPLPALRRELLQALRRLVRRRQARKRYSAAAKPKSPTGPASIPTPCAPP
jgi:transglutaminase-like putative cysteine protease